LADYFFDKGLHDISIERYQEAVAIFEWDISNAQCAEAKQEILAECYARLLDLEDEEAGPITEVRAELCYKLANCHVQVNKLEGKAPNLRVHFNYLLSTKYDFGA
jgi:hypothetical protein